MAAHNEHTQSAAPLSFRRVKGETSSSPNTMLRGHSQLDEGFSEETRSLSDSDMLDPADTSFHHILQMVLALPDEQRRRESCYNNQYTCMNQQQPD